MCLIVHHCKNLYYSLFDWLHVSVFSFVFDLFHQWNYERKALYFMYLSLQFSFWSCVASSCWDTLQHFITMLKGHPNVKLNTHAQILFQVDVEQSDKMHRPLSPGYSYAAGCDVLPGKPHSPIPCGDPRETFAHIGAIAREPHPDHVRVEDEILEVDRSYQSERKYFHKFQLDHLDTVLPPAVTGFHSRHVREIPSGSSNSSCVLCYTDCTHQQSNLMSVFQVWCV